MTQIINKRKTTKTAMSQSSNYWTMSIIDPGSHSKGYKAQYLPQAEGFFENHFAPGNSLRSASHSSEVNIEVCLLRQFREGDVQVSRVAGL
ncbi:MAG: hypothetical protein F6K58_31560, partial [Symploca sp. SIO2E9]|nr:hypothetical protein [Symploca sp. SIO2E9]